MSNSNFRSSSSYYVITLLIGVLYLADLVRSNDFTDHRDDDYIQDDSYSSSLDDVTNSRPEAVRHASDVGRLYELPMRDSSRRNFNDLKMTSQPEKVELSRLRQWIAESVSKRAGSGSWIWMPGQGYVAMPKANQKLSSGPQEANDGGKHGRIMRYGK